MPRTTVLLFCEQDGSSPLVDWLDGLTPKARDRCLARLQLLEEHGHDLRRPHADVVESTGLFELRVKFFKVNYRILYFFHGQGVAVVSHGFAKEDRIPPGEILLAQGRMEQFLAAPDRHTYRP